MPKKFPPAPGAAVLDDTNIHPAGDGSCDPLADMLFERSPEAEIADYLRQNFDEPNGRAMAELLTLMVAAAPLFQRAVRDGLGAALHRMEAEERLSMIRRSRPVDFTEAGLAEHNRMTAAAEAELMRWSNLAQNHDIGTEGLRAIMIAPAVCADPRIELVADTPAEFEELQSRRLAICNYTNEHKLEITTNSDGWPVSTRRQVQTSGTVRLVTVAEPGLRKQSTYP